MKRLKSKWLDYLSVVGVVGAVVLLLVLNIGWGNHWIDSDMAAEMIFSELLAEEGKWIATPDWYYSTEFRVLYTQLIMVPLHAFIENWQIIRIITNFVFYVGMIVSFLFVCKPLKIRNFRVRLCVLALLIPVSEAVMTHLQMGNTYMSHVILCFVTFGLYLRLCRKQCDEERFCKWKRSATWLVYISLCVILGISGVRYLLDLLVPIFLTAFIFVCKSTEFALLRNTPSYGNFINLSKNKESRFLAVGFGSVVFGGIGYLINVMFISKRFQFQTYDNTNFIKIHEGEFWDRVQNALGELLQMFGYIENKAFLSLRGLITILAFVMIGVLGYVWVKAFAYSKEKAVSMYAGDALQQEEPVEICRRFTVLFAGINLVLHLFVFIFTTSTMVDRYYIPIVIFFLLVLLIYMEWEKLVFDRVVVCLILGGSLALAGLKTCYSFITNDKNEARYEMAEFLLEEDYTFGYASYWNSNIMTELSDGALEMANLWSTETMGDFKWSSRVSSYEEKEGKIFLIASLEEIPDLESWGMLDAQEVIYENEAFIVLHFDSQEDFLAYREQ